MFNIGDRVLMLNKPAGRLFTTPLAGTITQRKIFPMGDPKFNLYNVRFDDIPFVTYNINEWMLVEEGILFT